MPYIRACALYSAKQSATSATDAYNQLKSNNLWVHFLRENVLPKMLQVLPTPKSRHRTKKWRWHFGKSRRDFSKSQRRFGKSRPLIRKSRRHFEKERMRHREKSCAIFLYVSFLHKRSILCRPICTNVSSISSSIFQAGICTHKTLHISTLEASVALVALSFLPFYARKCRSRKPMSIYHCQ